MPNTVRLTGAATADVVTVDVMVGATTSNDLYSFAFDLVLGDPTVAQYIVGSATIGDALTLGSGQQGQALAVQSGAMITVGVTKLGGGSGNGVDASEHAIVHLDFRVLKSGMTSINLSGSPPNPPAALDSTGTVVGSVHFDSAPAMIAGS